MTYREMSIDLAITPLNDSNRHILLKKSLWNSQEDWKIGIPVGEK